MMPAGIGLGDGGRVIRTLRHTTPRDTLLPKLISGELRIVEAA